MYEFIKNIFPKEQAPQAEPPPLNMPNNPYSVQFPVEKDPRTMGIDVQEEIEKIKATWRGMRLSDDGRTWVPIKNAKHMINEEGAETILGLYTNNMGIPNATTNLTEEQICKTVINFGDNLNELICGNYREFEIPKIYFDFIIDQLTNNFYTFLLKSLHDKQRMWDNRGASMMPTQNGMMNQSQMPPLTP